MRHLDLFAGIGGFSLAASWMGWETVAQVEWDKWCQKVLAKNFPDALRFGDIVEFNKMLENGEITTDTISQSAGCKCGAACDKERRTDEDRGESIRQGDRETCTGGLNATDTGNGINIGHIDIITGGFPCQPFSHAGKRKGVADERYLWPEMLRTIRIFKPSFVVGENVAGLVSMDNGKTLDGILSDLENEGYQVESFIIPACAVGAWHRRDRIWIVANCQSKSSPTYLIGKLSKQKQRELRGMGCKTNVSDTTSNRSKAGISEQDKGDEGPTRELNNCDCERRRGNEWCIKSDLGMLVDGLPPGLVRWDREPEGVPRVATGVKDRVNRLKGLGNAIVPQVCFELFKAIKSVNK